MPPHAKQRNVDYCKSKNVTRARLAIFSHLYAPCVVCLSVSEILLDNLEA